MVAVLLLFVLSLSCCLSASASASEQRNVGQTVEYDVSILIPVHRAPLAVLRSCWRQLNDLLAVSPSLRHRESPHLNIEVLWTRVNDEEDNRSGSSSSSSLWERARNAAALGVDSLLFSSSSFSFKHIPSSPSASSQPDSLSAAYNRLAHAASGKYLYLISDSILVGSTLNLESLIEPLRDESRGVGVTTNKVLFDDLTIASSGYSLLMARNPNKQSSSTAWSDSTWRGAASRSGQYSSWRNRNSRWSVNDTPKDDPNSSVLVGLHKTKSEVPVVHFPHAGFLQFDSRVSRDKAIIAAPYFSFMVPKSLFLGALGFNATAFPDAYFDVDLCLRLRNLSGLSTLYVANSSVVLSTIDDDHGFDSNFSVDNYNSERVKPSLARFTDTWFSYTSEIIEDTIVLKNLTLIWAMDCGAGQVLGFTTEATNIVSSIHAMVRTKISLSNSAECRQEMRKIGFPISTRKLLRILEERDDRRDDEHVVAVLHKDPGRYSFSIFQEPFRSASYVVGRSMYETTSIPTAWVQPCNSEVDAVWVPTEFNRETFASAGVNSSILFVVPEAIDLHHFDPAIVDSSSTLPRSPRFNFLSISKWEKRKAWDSLLSAYFQAFRASDPVTLTFRSNVNAENMKQYSDFVHNYAASHNMSVTDLPQVEFIRSMVPYSMLPFIYKSADAFVLASHGEGWGLPLMEAMSMQLPTIATNWSGNTAFMSTDNSFLIAVERMAPVEGEHGHSWAVPSVSNLVETFQHVFAHKEDARTKGERARSDLLHSKHLNAVSEIMTLLESIRPRLSELKRARESKGDQNMWSNTFQYSASSSTGSNTGWTGWSGSSTQQTFVDAHGRTRMRVKVNQ